MTQDFMIKTGTLPRRGESSRYNRDKKANETHHKYGKLGHFIKDFPFHKMKYKEYMKNVGDKRKE